jgi:hypothetical protein
VLDATRAAGITEDSSAMKRRESRQYSQQYRDNKKKPSKKTKTGKEAEVLPKERRPSQVYSQRCQDVKKKEKRKAVEGPNNSDHLDVLSGVGRSQRLRVSPSDGDGDGDSDLIFTGEYQHGGVPKKRDDPRDALAGPAPRSLSSSRMPRGSVQSVDDSKSVLGGLSPPLTQRSELLLPRLSEKQTTAVRTLDAKIRGMKRDTAVCSISSRHALTSTSFVSVTGSNLVDDSVMNAFMHLLDSDRLPHLEKTPFKVHAMKTHWYTKLALGGYADVQRWTSAKNCQHKDSCVTVPSLAPTSSLYQSTSRITGRAGSLT